MKKIILSLALLLALSLAPPARAQESVFSFDFQQPYILDEEDVKIALVDIYKNGEFLTTAAIFSFSSVEFCEQYIEFVRTNDDFDKSKTYWLLSGSRKVLVAISRDVSVEEVLRVNSFIGRFY